MNRKPHRTLMFSDSLVQSSFSLRRSPSTPVNKRTMKRILIINLAFIGDVLLSTPVARALRHAYPQARIDMMTVPVAAPLAQRNPYVDEVIVYDKKGQHKKWKALWQLLRQIRSRNYDLAVCTNFALRGAMLAFFCGIPRRLGYAAQHGEWFLTDAVSPVRPPLRHEAENYLDVLQPLGLEAADFSLELALQADDVLPASKEKEKADKPIVVLCPAGSYRRKSWTSDGYAKLMQKLSPQVSWYLIGGKAEAPYLQRIASKAAVPVTVWSGTHTLPEVAGLMQQAALVISVDTAALHMAQAVHTPVLGLFGPTDPRIWGPRGAKDRVVWLQNCQPCWGRGECATQHCLRDLSADTVIQIAQEMLAEKIFKQEYRE